MKKYKHIFREHVAGYLQMKGASLLKVGVDRVDPTNKKRVFIFAHDDVLDKALLDMETELKEIMKITKGEKIC